MPVSTRTRFEIFKRDRFTCQYCGRTPPEVLLHVDHIVPVSVDGGDEPENLRTACQECNLGKAARPLEVGSLRPVVSAEDIQERIVQAQAYAELLADSRTARDRLENQLHDLVLSAWMRAWGGQLAEREDGVYYELPNGGYFPEWRSVKNLLRRLSIDDIYEAIDITAARFPGRPYTSAVRYFYGVCWRIVRDRAS